MSTSIILLDQNFNANDVDIMVFEPCVLFPSAAVWGGGIDDMVREKNFMNPIHLVQVHVFASMFFIVLFSDLRWFQLHQFKLLPHAKQCHNKL